jgi:hypothetical protein
MSIQIPNLLDPSLTVSLADGTPIKLPTIEGELGAPVIIPIQLTTGTVELKDVLNDKEAE